MLGALVCGPAQDSTTQHSTTRPVSNASQHTMYHSTGWYKAFKCSLALLQTRPLLLSGLEGLLIVLSASACGPALHDTAHQNKHRDHSTRHLHSMGQRRTAQHSTAW